MAALFADKVEVQTETVEALAAMQLDPDIVEEERAKSQPPVNVSEGRLKTAKAGAEPAVLELFVPLNVVRGAHRANSDTKALLRSIGGLSTLRKFTSCFYEKAFADPHLDTFIRRHEDAHGERFATWITEKFGEGSPWTDERRHRSPDVMQIGGQTVQVSHDRSSAHFAAWNSPKRPAHKRGDHFKPEDARVWMRLHFWAARETGLFEPQHSAFMSYYVRLIGHFISVYSSKAPPFTRESARWSADQRNIDRYLASGNLMTGVIGEPIQEAMAGLPAHEQVYTGSKASSPAWPYGRDSTH